MALCLVSAQSWAAAPDSNRAALFASEAPFDMVVAADFKRLLRRSEWREGVWYDATVQVAADDGSIRALPARVTVRTGFRTRNDNCRFPQFFIDFSGADAAGTVFAGQNLLPMTTHCRASTRYSRYVHREMVAYRIYNILSPKSLRVRTANVTYRRSDNAKLLVSRQAFFVEHFDDLAARLDMERVSPEVFHPAAGDEFEMGVLELFQYMIGNTDWSAAFQHNILLLRGSEGPISAVPYDFDFSGLVNANYAAPASQFKTRSVRTRIYRGWCRGETALQRAVEHVKNKKPEVLGLFDRLEWIDEAVRADMHRYVMSFYEVLDSPDEFDRKIRSECLTGTPVKPEE